MFAQGKLKHKDSVKKKTGFLRLFGTDAAEPRSIGEHDPAATTHLVVTELTLVEGERESTDRLQTSGTDSLTVPHAATFGSFSLYFLELRL